MVCIFEFVCNSSDSFGLGTFGGFRVSMFGKSKNMSIFFFTSAPPCFGGCLVTYTDMDRRVPGVTRLEFELLRFVACRRPSHKEGGCMLHEVG